MNQELFQLLISNVQLLIKKYKSQSPKGWVKLQRVAWALAGICGAIVYASTQNWLNFLHLPATTYNNMLIVVNAIGAFLTACGFIAKFTTTDPTLISDEIKDAILNQAVIDGTHVPVSSSPIDTANKIPLMTVKKNESPI